MSKGSGKYGVRIARGADQVWIDNVGGGSLVGKVRKGRLDADFLWGFKALSHPSFLKNVRGRWRTGFETVKGTDGMPVGQVLRIQGEAPYGNTRTLWVFFRIGAAKVPVELREQLKDIFERRIRPGSTRELRLEKDTEAAIYWHQRDAAARQRREDARLAAEQAAQLATTETEEVEDEGNGRHHQAGPLQAGIAHGARKGKPARKASDAEHRRYRRQGSGREEEVRGRADDAISLKRRHEAQAGTGSGDAAADDERAAVEDDSIGWEL